MTTRKSTEERRSEIVDAAIAIIGERGLREFTAAHLAERVGIKDGTIFRHFKDKQAIMAAVLDRLEGLLLAGASRSGDEPLERLRGFVLSRLQAVAAQPGIQSIIFSDQLAHAMGDEGQRRGAAIRNGGRDFIRSCLREAAEKRLLREGLDVGTTVLLINGLVMSLLFAAKDHALDAPIEEVASRSLRTLEILLRR